MKLNLKTSLGKNHEPSLVAISVMPVLCRLSHYEFKDNLGDIVRLRSAKLYIKNLFQKIQNPKSKAKKKKKKNLN